MTLAYPLLFIVSVALFFFAMSGRITWQRRAVLLTLWFMFAIVAGWCIK